MRRWFLSYHSPDQALAERLKAAIEYRDATSRVFFAATHLRAGRSWSAQLADEIAQADAFILLIGEKGVGEWQELEYDEALDKWAASQNKSPDFPLIVVLLEGQTAPGLQFLRRTHWIITRDPGSEKDIGRIFDVMAGRGTSPGELWRHTSPYRGLEAMEEKDSDYFFGRERETVELLKALAAPDRMPVLIGNSGVGKSSLAKAGALAALKRQAWPEQAKGVNEWPAVFKNSRQWCYLSLKPGTEPIKALVNSFLDVWQFEAEYERVSEQNGWIQLLLGNKATLLDLMEATERRRAKLDLPQPPAFLLYIDQGEELYVRSEEHQRRRFSELIAKTLLGKRLRTMMSLRTDFLGNLHADKPLFEVRHQIDVPPLGEDQLRQVISRPAQLLGARFESEHLIEIITRRTAEDSVKDVGALPLLSYTLDDMWTQMIAKNDGVLRLSAPSFELGGVLAERANTFLVTHPGAEATVRRVFTLRCATVREEGDPTRRRASRSEFSEDEWRLVSELADHPNRLLVTVTSENGDIYAEVAHEAIYRRWDKLRDWVFSEREFLAWRSGLEAARRAWHATPAEAKGDALLMGHALAQAQTWLSKRSVDIPEQEQRYISLSRSAARRRLIRIQSVVALLVLAVLGAAVAWMNERTLNAMLQERISSSKNTPSPSPPDYQSTWMGRVGAEKPLVGKWSFGWEYRGNPELQFQGTAINNYVSFYLGAGRAVGLWIAYPVRRPDGETSVTLVTGYSAYSGTKSYREWKLQGEFVNRTAFGGDQEITYFLQWDLGLDRTNAEEFAKDVFRPFVDSLLDSTQIIVSTDDGLMIFPKIDVPNLRNSSQFRRK